MKCKQRFWEAKNPKGVVLLVHGMAEHMDRYEGFAEYLRDKHYHVYAYDQRGHGKTAGSVASLGYFGEEGWEGVVNDVDTMISYIKSTHDLPVVLFGHSMGSFVSRDFSHKHSNKIDGLILSGTGYKSGLVGQVMIGVASLEVSFRGKKHPATFISNVSNKVFNKQIKGCKTEFDWLSYNEENVQRYMDDPYCGTVFSCSFYKDLFKAVERVNKRKQVSQVRKTLPVFIVSGEDDPVGDYGKGVRKVKELYGEQSVQFKLYEGRHEILHEEVNQDVYRDVAYWLEEVLNEKI